MLTQVSVRSAHTPLINQAPPSAAFTEAAIEPTALDTVELEAMPPQSGLPWGKIALFGGLAVAGMALSGLGGTPTAQAQDVSQIYGRIQIVEHFADYDVEVVDHFPDLRVKVVDAFADSPGEWQIVDSFPDYKIRLVDHFGDFSIKWVDHFPGEP